MIKKSTCLFTLLLCLILSASSLYADEMEIYLYDPMVSSQIDVGKFSTTGQIQMLGDSEFFRIPQVFSGVQPGPAPPSYPHIHVWEQGIEQLGASYSEIDGIRFIQFGKYWMKHKLVLVLWKIRIPQASLRYAEEFEQDFTLSLWVDWNQDEKWGKNELLKRNHFNLHQFFPTQAETMCVYYLTWFFVPNIEDYLSSSWWWKRDIRELWIRGSLSYDDPDVSPDEEQLFGEVEDYYVKYWKL